MVVLFIFRFVIGKFTCQPEIIRIAQTGASSPLVRPTPFVKEFIGERMRLDKVRLTKDDPIHDMLEFYMGKNSPERQGFIVDNLRIEEDIVEGDLQIGEA